MQVIILASASGQHACVVYEAAVLSGQSVKGVAALDPAPLPDVLHASHLGGMTDLAARDFEDHLFVVACGSNEKRRQAVAYLQGRGARLASIVHPAAIVSPSATVGAGSMILAGAVIGPEAMLGDACIVNHCASVDHHCRLGDFANLSPGARLGGGVVLEDEVFLGLNACVLPRLRIGARSIVGAGAVVRTDVPPGTTMVGVPAVPIPSRG